MQGYSDTSTLILEAPQNLCLVGELVVLHDPSGWREETPAWLPGGVPSGSGPPLYLDTYAFGADTDKNPLQSNPVSLGL